MLDEKALRRETFAEGVAVRLCDGQEWTFPRPMVGEGDIYFAKDDAGATVVKTGSGLGPSYDDLLDRYLDSDEGFASMVALFDLAFALLSRNYDLTVADCRSLLRLVRADQPGRDESVAMWGRVADAALGMPPKLTAVGSGTP